MGKRGERRKERQGERTRGRGQGSDRQSERAWGAHGMCMRCVCAYVCMCAVRGRRSAVRDTGEAELNNSAIRDSGTRDSGHWTREARHGWEAERAGRSYEPRTLGVWRVVGVWCVWCVWKVRKGVAKSVAMRHTWLCVRRSADGQMGYGQRKW